MDEKRRNEMRLAIEADLRSALEVCDHSHLEPTEWSGTIADVLKKYIRDVALPKADPTVSFDKDTQTMTASFELSGDLAARVCTEMAAWWYDDGLTHDEVTRKLEKQCPEFRKVLAEVVLMNGARRWVRKPDIISMKLTISEAKR